LWAVQRRALRWLLGEMKMAQLTNTVVTAVVSVNALLSSVEDETYQSPHSSMGRSPHDPA
jgi:hypothetical protein